MVNKTNKKKAKKKIFSESLVVFFIAIAPFLYKVYEYLPYDSNGNLNIFGLTVTNNGFPDTSYYIWFLTGKIIPLYLLIFWFLTSRDWWYHIIIIPIAMYAFQFFEVLFDSDDNVDTENIWWLIPICMITIPFVYFIRIKLYDKHVHGIDLEALDAELRELKEKDLHSNTTLNSKEDWDINKEIDVKSISEELNTKLSTSNLENSLKSFQDKLQNWLNFKF